MKKKICLFSFLSLFLLIFISFSSFCYAEDENIYESNSKFSKYTNLVKGATYYEPIVIEASYIEKEYLPCDYIKENYNGRVLLTNEIEGKNIGFKINGEFFITLAEITKNGTYNIKVCYYYIENGISKPYETSLEDFEIYLNVNFEPEMSKTSFYLEHYINTDYLIEDIKKSFKNIDDSDIKILNKTKIEECLSNVRENIKDEDVILKFSYKNIEYQKNITIKTVKTSDCSKFILNTDEIFKDVLSKKYFFAIENIEEITDSLSSEYLNQFLNIQDKLIKDEAQSFSISYAGGKESSLSPNIHQISNVSFKISDNLKGYEGVETITDTTKNLDCWSYPFQNNFRNERAKFVPEVIFEDKIQIPINSSKEKINTILSQNIKEKYLYVEISEEERGYDYSFDNNDYLINLKNFNSSKIGETTIDYYITLETKYGTVEGIVKSLNVTIIEEHEPIILTKYNNIVLKNENDISYQREQVRVLNPDGTFVEKVSFKQINDKIEITAINQNGVVVTKSVPYVYEVKDNFFKKLLSSYGDFLRKVFN